MKQAFDIHRLYYILCIHTKLESNFVFLTIKHDAIRRSPHKSVKYKNVGIHVLPVCIGLNTYNTVLTSLFMHRDKTATTPGVTP